MRVPVYALYGTPCGTCALIWVIRHSHHSLILTTTLKLPYGLPQHTAGHSHYSLMPNTTLHQPNSLIVTPRVIPSPPSHIHHSLQLVLSEYCPSLYASIASARGFQPIIWQLSYSSSTGVFIPSYRQPACNMTYLFLTFISGKVFSFYKDVSSWVNLARVHQRQTMWPKPVPHSFFHFNGSTLFKSSVLWLPTLITSNYAFIGWVEMIIFCVG